MPPSPARRNSADAPWRARLRDALAVLVVVLACAAPASAQQPAARNADLAESIARAMNLAAMNRSLAEQMLQSLWRSGPNDESQPDRRAAVERLVRQAFDGERITGEMTRGLARIDDRAALTEWLAILERPLAQRIQEIEIAQNAKLATAEGNAALAAVSEPEPPRRALLDELDRLSRGSESAATIMALTLLAATASAGQRIADPRAALEALETRLMPAARGQMRAMYAFIYGPVSDADLAAYVALYRLPASMTMTPAFAAVVVRVLTNAMGEFVQGLRKLDEVPKGA